MTMSIDSSAHGLLRMFPPVEYGCEVRIGDCEILEC
jgi:hypothetical protein